MLAKLSTMEEKKCFLRQWLEAQEKRKAATAAMETYISEMAAEQTEEEDELTPMEAWWQECLKENQKFKELKRNYLERYERDYAKQLEDERKAKEYTKYGLDDWWEILEMGIKERMEEKKNVWCAIHRKRMAAKAEELRAKKRRILGVNDNPQDPSEQKEKCEEAASSSFNMKSLEEALVDDIE